VQVLYGLGWGIEGNRKYFHETNMTPLGAKMVVWHVILIKKCNISDNVKYKISF
jgi:hypothetical protein